MDLTRSEYRRNEQAARHGRASEVAASGDDRHAGSCQTYTVEPCKQAERGRTQSLQRRRWQDRGGHGACLLVGVARSSTRTPEPLDPASWRDAVAKGNRTIADAAAAARGCRACELWERATQTVWGRGP